MKMTKREQRQAATIRMLRIEIAGLKRQLRRAESRSGIAKTRRDLTGKAAVEIANAKRAVRAAKDRAANAPRVAKPIVIEGDWKRS
jgi:hypothetical protein